MKKQLVKYYDTYDEFKDKLDPAKEMQKVLSEGWTVVSITPITIKKPYADVAITGHLLVLFEKDEDKKV
jgi:hypothetical protein